MFAGTLTQHSLKDIWENSEVLLALRGMCMSNLSDDCQTCEYRNICGGGCRGAASQINHSLYGRDSRCPLTKEVF